MIVDAAAALDPSAEAPAMLMASNIKSIIRSTRYGDRMPET